MSEINNLHVRIPTPNKKRVIYETWTEKNPVYERTLTPEHKKREKSKYNLNKDVVNTDAKISFSQKVVSDANYTEMKNEEMKKMRDNMVLKELDTRHKFKLANISNQE